MTPRLGIVVGLGLSAYYSTLDMISATIMLLGIVWMNLMSSSIIEDYSTYGAFIWGVLIQAEAVGLQELIGHRLFEGNSVL